MTPDMINGLFELVGGILLILNVMQLYKDKKLNGVHWSPTIFFTSWGIWNLYYYPSLDQWYSFAGGLFIVTVNSIWLFQIYYYSKVYPKLNKKSNL